MVGPQAQRQAVQVLITERQLGVTRACGLVGISRSLFGYRSRRPPCAELQGRIAAIAALKRRFSHRRVYRLYREVGLAVRRRKRKRIGPVERHPLLKPVAPNVSWSMDFIADGLSNGRRFRCLAIVADFSRECLAIEVDTSLPGTQVAAVLDRLAADGGLPESITVDNGPEFDGRVLDEWAYRNPVRLAFIRPGKPNENAYIESWNGKFRDECLIDHWFMSLRRARELITAWRDEYNTERTHSSLGDITPAEFVAAYRQ